MEFIFHAHEGVVQSNGNSVRVAIDGQNPFVLPASCIYRIEMKEPQGDVPGQVVLLTSPSEGNPTGRILFSVDSHQYSEAQAFDQALRSMGQNITGHINPASGISNMSVSDIPSGQTKKLAWWIPVVSGFTALVLGVALGWGFTQMHAEHTLKEVVAAKDVEIERLDTSLNSVKAQLEAALGRDAGQGAGGDSGTSGDTEGRPNEEISNGGITMKLLESGEKPSISFDSCGDGCSNGKFAPKNPDADTKFWVATVEVTNNTKKPLDITCGYPYEIIALNSDNQQYTPIDDLYDVEGNPACNAELQPGTKTKVTYPFQVPLNAKMIGLAFRDIGDWSTDTPAQDNYAVIITDSNYHIS